MKKLITYLIIISGIFVFYSCDKPGPTELVDDTIGNDAEYEVLGKDVNDEFYSNGYDTTGISQDLRNFPNLIAVSGIKVTDVNGTTAELSFAQSIFFDRSKPVYDSNNRLLGYQTITPGVVRFDHVRALEIPHRIWYRENGILMDTLLGSKYVLSSIGNQFRYHHNSHVNFRWSILNTDIANFDIPTPSEIIGAVEISGNIGDNDLRTLLRWNTGKTEKITIIIAARLKNRNNIMPLYRVRVRDTGRLLIPPRFINNIPFQHFDRLVFTFIRRFEETFAGNNNNDLRISSQSIHSIIVNIP